MVHTYTLDNGKKVKVTAKNKRVAKKFFNKEHYAYTIVVEAEGTDIAFKTTYHDSIANYSNGVKCTKDTIDNAVYCIILDADSFRNEPNENDFLREYGYDEDEAQGHKVFNACRDTYKVLYTMLSEEEVDSLYSQVEQ